MTKTRRCGECGRFTTKCPKCHHRAYCYYCNSCMLHGLPRSSGEAAEAGQNEPSPELVQQGREIQERRRGRQWLVQVTFLTRKGWSDTFDVRVRAKGLAGAMWHGVREARRQHLPPRTVVRQARATVLAA